jgi:hypothetical protein
VKPPLPAHENLGEVYKLPKPGCKNKWRWIRRPSQRFKDWVTGAGIEDSEEQAKSKILEGWPT